MNHYTIIIPEAESNDFIGTLLLDILHDSKSRSTLYGVHLAKITDLIATSFILHNPQLTLDETAVNIYFFRLTLQYFCCELWDQKLSALGLVSVPDFECEFPEYWGKLRELVIIPLHNIADRFTECNFASLGGGRSSAESYNYKHQKDKLSHDKHEFIWFESPRGIRNPQDFITQQYGIIDIIQDRMGPEARVVLDMKSAAGLLRSITDAIGYINNIATNSDPGRDMPGMKGIRQYAHANERERNFQFSIKMETPFSREPCTILDISYIYEADTVRRANITILDNIFKARLPRSVDMSEALNQYLAPKPQDTVLTLKELVQKVSEGITELYTPRETEETQILQQLHTGASLTRQEILEWLRTTCLDAVDIYRVTDWILSAPIGEQSARIVYILKTIKNMEWYGETPDSIVPLRLVQWMEQEFALFKRGERGLKMLGFCHRQIELLYGYIRYPENTEQWDVKDAINQARIPGKRGSWCKFMTQLDQEWNAALTDKKLMPFRSYTDPYFERFLQVCASQLHHFVYDNPSSFYENVLCRLPLFDPPKKLVEQLEQRMMLLRPELWKQYSGQRELLLNEFLQISDSLIDVRFNRPFVHRPVPLQEENKLNALHQTLGKFSGDFGQIIWSLFHEQIFATEDNNASAMALIIQRIATGKKWATIHGLGDGTAVEITIKRKD